LKIWFIATDGFSTTINVETIILDATPSLACGENIPKNVCYITDHKNMGTCEKNSEFSTTIKIIAVL